MLGRSQYAIDDSRVTLQIVASLTDNSRGVIYDQNMFVVQATDCQIANNLLNCYSREALLKGKA